VIVSIKALIFLTTLTLIGIYGLECFVILPTGFEAGIIRRRLRGWAKGVLVGLLLATTGDLFLRSVELTGSLPEGLRAIPPILMQTHVGHVWIIRGALLTALLLIEGFEKVGLRWLRIVLGIALGVTIALTGHAADHGDFTLYVLMDSLHVIAAGLWVGGLFSLAIILRGDLKAMSPDTLARIIPRFSTLAGVALLAVVMGGAFNAWIALPNISALGSTTYGRILSLKLLAVSILVAFGAVNRYRVLPRLKHRQTGAGALFAKWIKREVWVALIVIGLTAILCETIPARHAIHAQQGMVDHQMP
jgi:putative copper resistance protein D